MAAQFEKFELTNFYVSLILLKFRYKNLNYP